MKNKFYMVQDKNDYEGLCNIVIASTAKEAKKIGSYCEATENLESWTDLEVKAIKGGMTFWQEDQTKTFEVGGSGFLYTDKEAQLDSWWDEFIKELKAQDRYIPEENDDV